MQKLAFAFKSANVDNNFIYKLKSFSMLQNRIQLHFSIVLVTSVRINKCSAYLTIFYAFPLDTSNAVYRK